MTPLARAGQRGRTAGSRRRARKAGPRGPIKRSRTHRGLRPSLRGRLIGLALVTAVLAISATILHYHSIYSRWIDALLVSDSPVSRMIWARPFGVSVGTRLTAEELTTRLARAGYKRATQDQHGWFEESAGVIVIPSSRGILKARFSGTRLAALSLNGQGVRSARLNPSFLSSFSFAGRERRKPLRFEDLPPHLIHAVISAEDDRFFRHGGIDLLGIGRALAVNLWSWEFRQGGSTLTQQFVKNYFLSSDRLVSRKLQELFLALLLERRLGKKQILLLYANDVYLGQIGSFAIHGLGQGAGVFFGKECRDLDLSEAATLAAMIPAPNKYSPYRSPDLVRNRRNLVLDQMERRGYITNSEHRNTRSQPLRFRKPGKVEVTNAPYFVDFLTRRLAAHPDIDLGVPSDIEVFSTLHSGLQIAAFQAVRTELDKLEQKLSTRAKPPRLQAALIAIDPRNGHILAMIGGRHYARSQYNRATRALRQPGSTFKPFVFAAALEESLRRDKRLTLATPVLDAPYTVEHNGTKYSPRNYRDQYSGLVSLRDALARSLNVPTVKVAEWAGLDRVTRLSEAMGFSGRVRPYPSLALGSFEVSLLELVQGYQVLANGGLRVPLQAWTRVEMDGIDLEEESTRQQVISPQTAFLVTSALQTALDQGTGKGARQLGFKLPAAGKTGTTNDSWFVGYTPDLLCGIWVGSDNPPDLKMAGSSAALPIWSRFMGKAREIGCLSGVQFTQPSGVLRVEIDERSGLRASRECRSVRSEVFLKGTEPQAVCRKHEAVLADRFPGSPLR